jgi:Na+/proline symporter
MNPYLLLGFVIGYFLLLLGVAWYTSRNSNNDSFFIGNRSSNWMLVAFGMIGTSLSGVTFVSVPGAVGGAKPEFFAYLQITLGYLLGYVVIAYVLLPLYYKMNLTSIYTYLHDRLGFISYKTGASFFILSRTLGATARLYLVVKILQDAILHDMGVPFWLTTLIILGMILIYTYEGGVKTIVYTDMLQTTCMLAGLIICVIVILSKLNLGVGDSMEAMGDRGYTKIFFSDPNSKFFFLKQILAGAFITVTMTGLDQEMMQKNISVKTLKDSQKNMMTLAVTMLAVITLFLFLGGLLYLYGEQLGGGVQAEMVNGVEMKKYVIGGTTAGADRLFPYLALNHMPQIISVIFIIALISALFPSADGAITALTSSFCIDIIGFNRKTNMSDAEKKKLRKTVHLVFAGIFLLFVMLFKEANNPSMIGVILKVAGFTYGPLLGLFAFGILTKRLVNEPLVPVVCIAAPLICFFLDKYQNKIFGGFEIGLELLIINGLLTFMGLMLISRKGSTASA